MFVSCRQQNFIRNNFFRETIKCRNRDYKRNHIDAIAFDDFNVHNNSFREPLLKFKENSNVHRLALKLVVLMK